MFRSANVLFKQKIAGFWISGVHKQKGQAIEITWPFYVIGFCVSVHPAEQPGNRWVVCIMQIMQAQLIRGATSLSDAAINDQLFQVGVVLVGVIELGRHDRCRPYI